MLIFEQPQPDRSATARHAIVSALPGALSNVSTLLRAFGIGFVQPTQAA